MPRRMKSLVLDSWAALTFFEDETAGKRIADLISDAHDEGIQIYMSVMDLAELWYIVAREKSEGDADEIIAELGQLGVEFVEVDWDLAREAAWKRVSTGISFACSVTSALARRNRADLVTGNPEFKKIEDQQNIRWI